MRRGASEPDRVVAVAGVRAVATRVIKHGLGCIRWVQQWQLLAAPSCVQRVAVELSRFTQRDELLVGCDARPVQTELRATTDRPCTLVS